jgi:hypothetical protein
MIPRWLSDERSRNQNDTGRRPGARIVSRPSTRAQVRAAEVRAAEMRAVREHDLLDLLSVRDTRDAELRGAVVTLLSECNAKVLAAFGTLLRFVTRPRPTRRRPRPARRQ